jgi:hypothetical protein
MRMKHRSTKEEKIRGGPNPSTFEIQSIGAMTPRRFECPTEEPCTRDCKDDVCVLAHFERLEAEQFAEREYARAAEDMIAVDWDYSARKVQFRPINFIAYGLYASGDRDFVRDANKGLNWTHRCLAFEDRLLLLATNSYQRRLTKIALKHTPDNVNVMYNERHAKDLDQLHHAGSAHYKKGDSVIYLREPPISVWGLFVYLHELSHIALRHKGGKKIEMSPGYFGVPWQELAADKRAQRIMQHSMRQRKRSNVSHRR